MKKRFSFFITLIFCVSFLTLNAQNWNEIINATASDAATSDEFGFSVAIDGDYAIVGAHIDDDSFADSGSAYIFIRSGSNWIQQAKLTASDAAESNRFGTSVSIDGDYAIVGANKDDDVGYQSGSAYIFLRSGTSWTEQAKLTASDAAINDEFGYSVSIDGDYAIVGGRYNKAAYIFMRSGVSWTEQVKLTASDAGSNDFFGSSVDIHGDYAIVGAYFNSGTGSAYIFKRSGASWTEQVKLTASDAASNAFFGNSVALSGDFAIIGSRLSNNVGSAYIFARSGSTWTEQAKLTASDAASQDEFGFSVAIRGDFVFVGAPYNDDAGSASGAAYIFKRFGINWTEQAKLTASDGAVFDQFGYSVAIDDGTVIAGARGNDDLGSGSGSAYFFSKAISLDTEILTDLSAECELTPTPPTANSGAITATSNVTFPVTTQGTTIVTWTYDDGNGNTETQTQNIIIDDTTGPNLSFTNPSDALIESCATEVIVPAPLAIEGCLTNEFALDFDGVDDMVTVNQTIGSFKTIEFWMYTENGINGSEEFDYLFSFNDSNLKYIGTGNFTSNYTNETLSMVTNFGEIMTTYAVIPPGWNHIAFTGNGSSFNQIIINGESKPVVNNGFPQVFEATTTYLGQSPSAVVSRFNGKLDEVRFWDTARTEQDIANDYEKMIDASTTDLLAYYDFEDGPGSNILTDKTGNGAQGVLNNMDVNTNWVSSTVPVASVTLTNDFNGTSDASGTYPDGETTITWTATDANGNQSTLEQIVNIDCSITYTFNNGDWSPSDPGGVATVDDDIVIVSGNAVINTNTSCDSVTVNPGAGLTVNAGVTLTTTNGLLLESNSTSYSSLILDGTVAGMMTYERHVNINGSGTTGSNDLISAPLTGQDFATFAAANPNIFNNGTVYLFGPLEKATGQYVNWTGVETATLDAGVGYRAATNDNSVVSFTGTANNSTIINNIINAGTNNEEWNLVGNPYPSYLNVQDFLSQDVGGVTNIQLFDTPTAAIYGYDGTAQNGWTIYNLANTTTSTIIAPGQGFFVSADATNAPLFDLQFTPAMRRIGNGDDFVSGRNAELTYVKLNTSTANNTYNTEFYFNANATEGFDIGYDAALWETTAPTFSIYSHLLQDNVGKSIALQTLNITDLTEVSIPLGVNANQGEQLTFSIVGMNIPASVNVYLDDVVANTTTLLNTGDYVMTPSTGLSGTGRFYLRTSENALSTIENSLNTLSIFALNSSKELVVTGQLKDVTTLNLYDIQGRKIFTSKLDNAKLENRIDVSNLSVGVYIVNVQNTTQQKSQKVIIK